MSQHIFFSPEVDFPLPFKRQALALTYAEWPTAFSGPPNDDEPLNAPEREPHCIAWIENGEVLSYTGVQFITLSHDGKQYRAAGISGMLTAPQARHRGLGLKVLRKAAQLMQSQAADISVFTCDPPLAVFYAAGGWEVLGNTPLIGGSRERPMRSDDFGKLSLIRCFTDHGESIRPNLDGQAIWLDLGERQLW
ncbi:GNAT family N-acetyltransferase [Parachitinimonas caeni]|uniref:GNAT family N-acetyltransferase n=1 Tax=Parachitinimonas caeni TaxID=3031301 RepID=A0ABT7DY11_9NEIS|nr:GNAT family N-acetyltransferase [Parachitinimonas caeni]MDK2124948.1 GNAT family N-acetyltransferase [Parachitinimonas caeni]